MSRDETAGGHPTDHLLAFIGDPEEYVVSMSSEEVQAYLKEEGIDTSAAHQELMKRMSVIRGQQRLEAARRKKDELDEKLSGRTTVPRNTMENVRAEIERLLGGAQPKVAQAYFRKLEGATEKDMESMLDDLHFLDESSEDEC